MKHRALSILSAALLIGSPAALLIGSPVAHADELTFVASGQVTWITPGANDFDGYLARPVQVGDELRFSYTFESTTAGWAPTPGEPRLYYEAIKRVRIEVSGNVLEYVPCGNCAHRIWVEDDRLYAGVYSDVYQVTAQAPDTTEGRSPSVLLQLIRDGYAAPVAPLTSTQLPLVPPDPAAFAYTSFHLAYGSGMQIDVGTVSSLRIAPDDSDGDGIQDSNDNCPQTSNADQTDTDADGLGDVCDEDDDNDGVPDAGDNCALVINPDQRNVDGDGFGDVCDGDIDGDGVANASDNCPAAANPDQTDTDGDGAGDECDSNDDDDAQPDDTDNCPSVPNDDQQDLDQDDIGDVCDVDLDGDGIANVADNCPIDANPSQDDTDGDTAGDTCDFDDDADGILDGTDNCPLIQNASQADNDHDGAGDACDVDLDGDGATNVADNCPNVANSGQADFDLDGIGDACDDDADGDGALNTADACSRTPREGVTDSRGCTIEQLCPCDGPSGTVLPWRNHGKYVSCIAQAANRFLVEGLISSGEHDEIVSAAAHSVCGGNR